MSAHVNYQSTRLPASKYGRAVLVEKLRGRLFPVISATRGYTECHREVLCCCAPADFDSYSSTRLDELLLGVGDDTDGALPIHWRSASDHLGGELLTINHKPPGYRRARQHRAGGPLLTTRSRCRG